MPWARLALLACAIIVLALAVALVVRGCGASVSLDAEEDAPAQAAVEQPIDRAALDALLAPEVADALVEAAATDEDAAWVAAHPQAYAMDGEAVQAKLLKLAALEPAARPFVRSFPDAYPAEEGEPGDVPEPGQVPRLYQWDPRWGATVYSSTTFALTGCCPTSLAMACQALTGDASLTPYEMACRAQEGGYMSTYNGTDGAFVAAAAAQEGLACRELALDADELASALSDGAVAICNVGPGDFTDGGHFLVIAGLDDDGRLVVNDPNSAVRSDQRWDAEQVLSQAKRLWALSR